MNPGWTDAIAQANAGGKKVIGYVRTGYLGVSWQKFTTRLGSSRTSDWVAQIQEDVDQWYRLYPGQIGGIFFDEAWNDCGENNVNAELYKFITQSTKRKYPGAFTVLNPGAPMPQCFEHSADTLMTYESDYETYVSNYNGNTWMPKDPRKIWHIIHTVPRGQEGAVARLALSRGVGMVEITDDVMPNPYDTLPDEDFMNSLMDAVEGGKPLNEGIFEWPGIQAGEPSTTTPNMNTVTYDYSSVEFSWVGDGFAAGYRMYQDGDLILELPPSSDRVTVGGLAPGATYRFQLASIYMDGRSAVKSETHIIPTTPLPGSGHTVESTSVSATGSQTTYKARILVPYAFVRVFIFDDNTCGGESAGWPINYDDDSFACARYVIEGGTLYQYNGKHADGENAPWVWKWLAEVPIVQEGYDFTFDMPMGTSTIDTTHYLVQVQGYGPMANVLHYCPSDWGAGKPYSKVDTYCDHAR